MTDPRAIPDRRAPISAHETPTPGPKVDVTLRLGERSLSELLEGAKVERMWLTEEEPGIFELHANRTLGEARKDEGVKPAIDVLVRLLNEFGLSLDENWDALPLEVRTEWDHLLDAWNAYPTSAASDEFQRGMEG